MAHVPFLFYACGGLSLLAALLGLLALGDVVQLVASFPRRFTYGVFKLRFLLITLALAGFAVTMALGIAYRLAPWWALALYAVVFAVFFLGGFAVPSYVMFRSQQHSARFVPVGEVSEQLPDSTEVLVVEVNGDGRAFPNLWILRPHVAGDVVGGEEVLMTYCGLSHLGLAYRNELDGRKLDLKVLTQLENNLVLFDAATQQPIEQIFGRAVETGSRLPLIPTTVMPLGSFRELYPEGKVFFNPTGGFLDRQVRRMMHRALFAKGGQYDPASPRLAFPTIHHLDPRVPAKEQVYGIALDGEAVAFTLGYLMRNGGVVRERLGEAAITVKHFPEHGFVDVFYGDVEDVDPRGFGPDGLKQRRVPHSSRVLWVIWSNFYRNTDVRV